MLTNLILGPGESSSSPRASSTSSTPRPTNASSSESSPSDPAPSQANGGVNHPPPQMLADVMEEYQRVNRRLVQQQNNLIPVLRNDVTYSSDAERDRDQQLFNRVSRITHYLSHAQHAMSDILLNLSRAPPRQLRARLFIIPSIVQTARVQAVPIDYTMQVGSPSRATSSTATSQPAQSRIGITVPSGTFTTSTSGSGPRLTTSTSFGTTSTGTNTRRTGVPLMLPPGIFPVRAGPTATGNSQMPAAQDNIQSIVLNALNQAFRNGGENSENGTGPSISVSTSESGAQERTSQPTGTSSSSSSAGISAGLPPIGGIPMSPQIGSPLLGNLNSFDPFLTCSSHHISQNSRSQNRGRLIVRNQRSARSEPNSGVNSRNSSLDRRGSSFLRTRAASTQGRTSSSASSGQAPSLGSVNLGLIDPLGSHGHGGSEFMTLSRMMSQFLGNGATDSANDDQVRGLLNMATGVLGQVIGSLHGETSNQTIADFLNSLPDYNYVQGDNLWSDLMMALARRLTFSVSIDSISN